MMHPNLVLSDPVTFLDSLWMCAYASFKSFPLFNSEKTLRRFFFFFRFLFFRNRSTYFTVKATKDFKLPCPITIKTIKSTVLSVGQEKGLVHMVYLRRVLRGKSRKLRHGGDRTNELF